MAISSKIYQPLQGWCLYKWTALPFRFRKIKCNAYLVGFIVHNGNLLPWIFEWCQGHCDCTLFTTTGSRKKSSKRVRTCRKKRIGT